MRLLARTQCHVSSSHDRNVFVPKQNSLLARTAMSSSHGRMSSGQDWPVFFFVERLLFLNKYYCWAPWSVTACVSYWFLQYIFNITSILLWENDGPPNWVRRFFSANCKTFFAKNHRIVSFLRCKFRVFGHQIHNNNGFFRCKWPPTIPFDIFGDSVTTASFLRCKFRSFCPRQKEFPSKAPGKSIPF